MKSNEIVFFSAITTVLSAHLNRNAAFIHLAFYSDTYMAALTKPSVLVSKAAVDGLDDSYVPSPIWSLTTFYLNKSSQTWGKQCHFLLTPRRLVQKETSLPCAKKVKRDTTFILYDWAIEWHLINEQFSCKFKAMALSNLCRSHSFGRLCRETNR